MREASHAGALSSGSAHLSMMMMEMMLEGLEDNGMLTEDGNLD